MPQNDDKERKFRAVPTSLVKYNQDRTDDDNNSNNNNQSRETTTPTNNDPGCNSLLEQVKQEQLQQREKSRETTTNSDRSRNNFLEQVKQEQLQQQRRATTTNNDQGRSSFLERVKQQQQQLRQPQRRTVLSDSSAALVASTNTAAAAAAAATTGTTLFTTAQCDNAPISPPAPPGAFAIAGTGRSITTASSADCSVHEEEEEEEEDDEEENDDHDDEETAGTMRGSTTTYTAGEGDDGAYLVTAQLVVEDSANNDTLLQNEIERLRRQQDSIPVVAAIDEQADRRKLWRRLGVSVVVIFTIVVALAAGLSVGANGNDSEPPQDGLPLNLSKVGLSLYAQAVELEDYYNFVQQTYGNKDGATSMFTILAPTDVAFRAIPQNYFENFPTSYWRHIREILVHQTFRGSRSKAQFQDNEMLVMLGGNTLTVLKNTTTANSTNVTTVWIDPSRYRSGDLLVPDLVPRPGFVLHSVDGIVPVDFLERDAVDVALMNNLTLIVDLIVLSGFENYARTTNDFTAFLPTNAALEKVPPEELEKLSSNAGLLIPTFLKHVYPGIIYSEGLGNPNSTVGQQSLDYGEGFQNRSLLSVGTDLATMEVLGDGTVSLTVDGVKALVVRTDLLANNAVIHMIDTAFYVF